MFDRQEEYAAKEVFIGDVLQVGDQYLKDHSEEEFLSIAKSLKNDDLATITYTSGTTAEPKGVNADSPQLHCQCRTGINIADDSQNMANIGDFAARSLLWHM